ncbi:MAG: class I SAM-dependent methyltransferase [Bacteroidia bacterium]
MTAPLKIEIGSGKKPRIGYKTCDIRELPGVDYVCSADALPFENNSVDEIFSRHVVEHFTLKEFLNVLKEWNRVLKPNGGGDLYYLPEPALALKTDPGWLS